MAQKIEELSQLSFRQFMDLILKIVKSYPRLAINVSTIKDELKYKVVYPDKELADALERLVAQGELAVIDFQLNDSVLEPSFKIPIK